MLIHAGPPNIPASVNCFYEYLSTQKKVFTLTRIKRLRFEHSVCFGSLIYIYICMYIYIYTSW